MPTPARSHPVEEDRLPTLHGPGALDGLKVLDLSGAAGQYCGKLFADLGAQVTLIEPLTGSPTRRDGPFLDDAPSRGGSLSFAYFNASKRSLALDLDHAEGQALLRRLASDADLLIESDKPGTMARRGLDAQTLIAHHPRLVVTSITPFGQTGPYAQHEAEDIVALALGGLLYLGGYPHTEPMAAWGQQAYLAAAQFAAVASMMAITGVELGQPGRHVDVSIQESVVLALENAVQFFDLEGTVRKRYAGQQRQAGMGVFPCADGQVYFMAGGVASNRFWAGSVQWLIEEGAPGAAQLKDPKWLDNRYLATDEARRIFASVFEPFSRTRTKAQLYAEGQARRLPICPINTPADLLENRQLQHRGHFTDLPLDDRGRSARAPGAPYRLSASPWQPPRRAPRLGEHTAQALAALGLDATACAALLREGVIA